MRIVTALIILFGCITGTGCGTSIQDPVGPPDSASTTPQHSTLQPASSPEENITLMPPTPITTHLQNLITTARDDLAGRLSIPPTNININEAREVTWSDASLGCPQAGMAYADVLTPGYLIVLEYAGNRYEYHAGRGPEILYCENPMPPVPGMPDNT